MGKKSLIGLIAALLAIIGVVVFFGSRSASN